MYPDQPVQGPQCVYDDDTKGELQANFLLLLHSFTFTSKVEMSLSETSFSRTSQVRSAGIFERPVGASSHLHLGTARDLNTLFLAGR